MLHLTISKHRLKQNQTNINKNSDTGCLNSQNVKKKFKLINAFANYLEVSKTQKDWCRKINYI